MTCLRKACWPFLKLENLISRVSVWAPRISLFTHISKLEASQIHSLQSTIRYSFEIFPVYVCCYLWGKEFHGKCLLFHCDNLAVVNIWSDQSCKSPEIMAVLRKLFYIAAQHEFTVNVKHIPGVNNVLADCLSRSQISKFFTLAPSAKSHPAEVPDDIWKV